MDYAAYLRSKHWQRIKKAYRESDRPQVCICGERKGLELHHKTYERLGAERLDDLQLLCQPCHATIHQVADQADGSLHPNATFSPLRALENRATNPVVARYHEERIAKADKREEQAREQRRTAEERKALRSPEARAEADRLLAGLL